MATEAGRLSAQIVVAAIAKLFLVAVAFQTGAGQAYLENTSVASSVKTLPLADSSVAPGAEKPHMTFAHERCVFYAALFFQLRNGGRIEAQLRRRGFLPFAVPEGESDHDDKDHQSQYD